MHRCLSREADEQVDKLRFDSWLCYLSNLDQTLIVLSITSVRDTVEGGLKAVMGALGGSWRVLVGCYLYMEMHDDLG